MCLTYNPPDSTAGPLELVDLCSFCRGYSRPFDRWRCQFAQKRHRMPVTKQTESPRQQFPVDQIRSRFPALQQSGFIYFDNAAGAQIPRGVFDAVNHHLLNCNVQRGGRYEKSKQVDSSIAKARESVAILLNARDPSEVAFGMNATSFIRLMSLAIGQTLGTGSVADGTILRQRRRDRRREFLQGTV